MESSMKTWTLVLLLAACAGDKSDGEGPVDETGDALHDLDEDGFDAPEDCDDSSATIFPGGTELCNGLDDDCDGEIDESVEGGTLWYLDEDGDGYGDRLVDTCEVPEGATETPGDCDDANAAVNPDASEVCDGLDNDCDDEADEESAADAGTWYADADGDGFGQPDSVAIACLAPEGYVADAMDCDDAIAAVNPDASEICDGLDNDCDGETDEDEAVDAGTWYADADGDGYGDASEPTIACTQPEDTSTNADDCDDGDAEASPEGEETCDGAADEDCDGEVDEGSAIDAGTWYADADGDGYGDPASGEPSCEQPAGYVSDATDCDDSDAEDTDGDGAQDCADEDIDGDGLRNGWDADPYDDAVVRGPHAGLGGDGDWSVSGTTTLTDWTLLDGSASAGDTLLSVDDATAFVEGDELLVLSQQGSDAGTWDTVFVASVSGDTITTEPALSESFSASSVVLVQRIPHYGDLDVPAGAAITAEAWAGAGGGVIAFRATGTVTIAGEIEASGLGYRGGDAVSGNSVNPYQGESYRGTGARGTPTANYGGGGSYPQREDHGDSGGGGGYGSPGGTGLNYAGTAVTSGGSSYGDDALLTWFVGSGGGAGAPDDDSDGTSSSNRTGGGGDGGGLIAIWAGEAIALSGALRADGGDASTAVSGAGGDIGGGGGGSGGQILLASPSLTLSGTVSAQGGDGSVGVANGTTSFDDSVGGDGGEGRVRLEYALLGGVAWPDGDLSLTTPEAGSSAIWED